MKMKLNKTFHSVCLLLMMLMSTTVFADENSEEEEMVIEPAKIELGRPVSFGKDIAPIFKAKCLACHSASEAESEVNLESVATILKGGDSGELLNLKEPENSLLFKVVIRDEEYSPMPPLPNEAGAKKLTPQEAGLIRQWIIEGAKADPKGTVRKINWRPVPEDIKAIYSLDISEDGRFVAYGRANQIYIQDMASGGQSVKLTDPNLNDIQYQDKPMYPGGASHRDSVFSLSFSDDGQWLASGGYRVVKLWNRTGQAPVHSAKTDQQVVSAVVSDDGSLIAEAGADHIIRIRNLADSQVVKELKGHADQVTSLGLRTLSADTSNADLNQKLAALELVSSSKDQTVKVWDLTAGTPKYSLKTPSNQAIFNKDGSQVITAGEDSIIRLWKNDPALYQDEANPGQPVMEVKGHAKQVTALELMEPAGAQLLSGSEDGTVRLWNLADGKELKNLNHQAPIVDIAVTADGKRIASSGGNLVRLWNGEDGKQIFELKGDPNLKTSIQGAADEVTIAKEQLAHLTSIVQARDKDVKDREETLKKSKTAKEESAKKITEAEQKQKAEADALEKLKQEAPKPEKEELNEEEKKAFAKKEEEHKKKLEEAEKKLQAAKDALEKAKQDDMSAARAITLNEKSLEASKKRHEEAKADEKAGADLQKARETAQQEAQKKFDESVKPINQISFSHDGSSLLTAGETSGIDLWDVNTGQHIETFTAHAGPITFLRMLADGKMVSLSSDQNIFVWNTVPGWNFAGVLGPDSKTPLEVELSPIKNRVMAIDFSSDGKLLATGGGDPSRNGELLIWDVPNRKILRTVEDAHVDTVMGVEFSHDDKKLASASADKFVKVFDTETGKYIRSFEGHTNYVLDVTWKADSLTLASAGADNVIKVWNSETGEQRRTISGFSKQVASIDFIGVGQNLVSCSGDKSIRLYQSSDGKNLRSFPGATEFAHVVASSRDGEVVASGGEDGVLRIWRGKDNNPVKTLSP